MLEPLKNTLSKNAKANPSDLRPGLSERDYAERIRREIETYRYVENVHDLPEIFHFWSNKYVRPKMEEVLGVSSFEDFYAKYILQYRKDHPQETIRIASLGVGNGDLEVRVAKTLRERQLTGFLFQCLDINPNMLSRGRELAAEAQLSDSFEFIETDLSCWSPQGHVAIVMAHHSLHHLIALEETFSMIRRAIGDQGYFLSCDMIGRNGHMRWPEALEIVHDIWRTMPDRYKYNHQLRRFEELYENWDCSKEGFEGIRAEDILPLLLKNFHFEAFVAYGNLPDIFIDRGFGHNFRDDSEEDRSFIDRIGALNDRLIGEGAIKPTQMIAVLRTRPVAPCRCHQHWTPEFCVRPVEGFIPAKSKL